MVERTAEDIAQDTRIAQLGDQVEQLVQRVRRLEEMLAKFGPLERLADAADALKNAFAR